MLATARVLRSLCSGNLVVLALGCSFACVDRSVVPIRILAVNDFHGYLEPADLAADGRAPGAAILADRLREARDDRPGATLIVSAGDLVGASPPVSSVLSEEPTIAFVNTLANDACRFVPPESRQDLEAVAGDPRCDVVAVVGNHELEDGVAELIRLTRGGDRPGRRSLEKPWRGARLPFVVANVVSRSTGNPVFPPSVVRDVGGVRVGVVGAVLRGVARIVGRGIVGDLEFLEPADAINAAVRDLVARGVRAVVVVVHEGGAQEPYAGPTRVDAPPVTGPIAELVARLDDEVDVVVTAHTHEFTNALLPNASGRPVLVTQARFYGTAFAQIDLAVDTDSGDVVAASARIEPVDATDAGSTRDAQAAAVVAATRRRMATVFGTVVARAGQPLLRGPLPLGAADTGEWPLGDVVADAFREAMDADIGLAPIGAVRGDIPAGPVPWSRLYGVLPAGDTVVRLTLTGGEIRTVLEEQWMPTRRPAWRSEPYILQVSGLDVTWDGARPQGEHIVALAHGGQPLRSDVEYTVAMPGLLANGYEGFHSLATAGRDPVLGPRDVDAVEAHLAALAQPVLAPPRGRIVRRR